MSRHEIKRNDTRPYWPVDLTFSDGSSPTLTGATVRFIATGTDGQVAIDAAAVITEENAAGTGVATVEWRPAADETDVAGRYDCEWEVTFADTTIQTFPTRGYDRLTVLGDLG